MVGSEVGPPAEAPPPALLALALDTSLTHPSFHASVFPSENGALVILAVRSTLESLSTQHSAQGRSGPPCESIMVLSILPKEVSPPAPAPASGSRYLPFLQASVQCWAWSRSHS